MMQFFVAVKARESEQLFLKVSAIAVHPYHTFHTSEWAFPTCMFVLNNSLPEEISPLHNIHTHVYAGLPLSATAA